MYKKVQFLLLVFSFWLTGTVVHAQGKDSVDLRKVWTADQQRAASDHVEMADRFRADGKIYVVVAVVVIILAGLILYVARLDRKISRLEKDISADKR